MAFVTALSLCLLRASKQSGHQQSSSLSLAIQQQRVSSAQDGMERQASRTRDTEVVLRQTAA
jgi:hypothetical protein